MLIQEEIDFVVYAMWDGSNQRNLLSGGCVLAGRVEIDAGYRPFCMILWGRTRSQLGVPCPGRSSDRRGPRSLRYAVATPASMLSTSRRHYDSSRTRITSTVRLDDRVNPISAMRTDATPVKDALCLASRSP